MKRRFAAASLSLVVVTLVLLPGNSADAAVIPASGDITKPSTSSNYSVTGSAVPVVESVSRDPLAGPWLTNFTNNTGGGRPSGQDTTMIDVLTNLGALAWTGWHEKVESRTTQNTPNDSPGFLFDSIHLQVMGDYGSGFVTLTQGVDYTVSP